MKPLLMTLVAALSFATVAQAGDVFVTKDAKGQPVFTDRPEVLPAERIDVKTQQTDTVAVQKRYADEMKRYSEADKAAAAAAKEAADAKAAKQMSAEDRAKLCQQARERYDSYMNARRLYEKGEKEGERRYLTDSELDAARANAKQSMDDLCSGL